MKKAALYIRVSTTEQNTDMQRAELAEYADRRGFSIFRTYEETASGAARSRPQLDALTRDAKKRLFDIVIVWKFDRLARSLSMLINALDTFQALGIDFISLRESIDTTTPIGKLSFQITAAFAEFERDVIKERVKAGIKTARTKRETWGRPEQGKDTQDKIKAMRAAGTPIRAIARELKIAPSTVSKYKV